jgi:hypothetical protein
MKLYVASYEDASGNGYQKIFRSKKNANIWMYNKFIKDYCIGYGMTNKEKLESFKDHKNYGAFSAKIKQFKVKL